MAETTNFDLPYPLSSDPVNVHGDLQALAEQVDLVLQTIAIQDVEVRNNTGATISKGTPVYISGFNTKPTIDKCDADIANTFPVAGITTTDISSGADGNILISGVLNDFNTTSYTTGDRIYVASGGGITKTKPTNGGAVIGVILESNASTGKMLFTTLKGNGTWGSLKEGLS
jgi:predicted RecA/RadA family phage recombinase